MCALGALWAGVCQNTKFFRRSSLQRSELNGPPGPSGKRFRNDLYGAPYREAAGWQLRMRPPGASGGTGDVVMKSSDDGVRRPKLDEAGPVWRRDALPRGRSNGVLAPGRDDHDARYHRVEGATVWVAAVDVMRLLGCSRSAAYRHLRRAAGRGRGTRRILRVSVEMWEQYAAALLQGQPAPGATATRPMRRERRGLSPRTTAGAIRLPRKRLVFAP